MKELPHELLFGDVTASVSAFARYLVAARRLMAGVLVACLAVGALQAFLAPEKYRATVTMYINAEESGLAGFGGLNGLAGGLGLPVADGSLAVDIADLARSRRVRSAVLAQTWAGTESGASETLYDHWQLHDDASGQDAALRRLRAAIDVSRRPTGLMAVSVTLTDPVLAAGVASFLGDHLRDEYVRLKQGNATMDRQFIGDRLDSVTVELDRAEETLIAFDRANVSTEQSPSLQQRRARLEREVDILGSVYRQLRPQFEIARIEEVRARPAVEILDRAVVPTTRISPNRGNTMVVWALLGVAVAVLAALGTGYVQYLRREIRER